MKLLRFAVLLLFVYVVPGLADNIPHKSPTPQFDNRHIYQVSFLAPFVSQTTQWFEFTGDLGTQSQIMYAQVIVRDLASVTQQQVWAIRNLPVLPFHPLQTLSQLIDLGALNVTGSDPTPTLGVYSILTPTILTTVPNYDTLTADKITYTGENYYIPDGTTEQFALPLLSAATRTLDATTSTLTDTAFFGNTIPNIDLDSTTYNAVSVTSYAGDINACGIAAAANTMQWWENLHPEFNTNLAHRQKLEELSGLIKRGSGVGVTAGQLVKAELAFIDKHKLPLTVKFQSAFLAKKNIPSPDTTGGKGYAHQAVAMGDSAAAPTWSWLVSSLQHGDGVQMMIGIYNSFGRISGHWVTVVGAATNGDIHHLWMQDDRDQRGAGGTTLHHITWDTANAGWPYVVEQSIDGVSAYIESLVSVGYDPAIKYDVTNISAQQFHIPNASPADVSGGNFIVQLDSTYRLRFLNVLARNPIDTTHVVWLVKNLLWMPNLHRETISNDIDLSAIGVQPGTVLNTLDIDIQDSYVQWTAQGTPNGWQSIEVSHPLKNIGEGAISTRTIAFAPLPDLNFTSTGPTRFDTLHRIFNVPDIDLDSSTNFPGSVAGYAGDASAGAPAAAANSLQWLERTNSYFDSTSTTRQKLVELSGLMKRAANKGVTMQDYLRGKLAYIDKHKTPMSIKFQSVEFPADSNVASPDTTAGKGYGHAAINSGSADSIAPSWDFLYQAVRRGDGVEISTGRYDSTGKRIGGNVLMVTGAADIGDGVPRIWIRTDEDQRDSGGTVEFIVAWDSTNGMVALKELSGANHLRVVEAVITENYDPTVTFKITNVDEAVALLPSTLLLMIGTNPAGRDEATTIAFSLASPMPVSVAIYNMLGTQVAELRNEMLSAGSHQLTWNGCGASGVPVSAGTYFAVVKTPTMQASSMVVRMQ